MPFLMGAPLPSGLLVDSIDDLHWKAWWNGDNYSAGVATGQPSAGPSGSRHTFSLRPSLPVAGNPANGHNAIIANASSHHMLETGIPMENFIASNKFLCYAVIRLKSVPAVPAIFQPSAYLYGSVIGHSFVSSPPFVWITFNGMSSTTGGIADTQSRTHCGHSSFVEEPSGLFTGGAPSTDGPAPGLQFDTVMLLESYLDPAEYNVIAPDRYFIRTRVNNCAPNGGAGAFIGDSVEGLNLMGNLRLFRGSDGWADSDPDEALYDYRYLDADVFEVLITDRAYNPLIRQLVRDTLMTKYGIPASPAIVSLAPNPIGTSGGAVTITGTVLSGATAVYVAGVAITPDSSTATTVSFTFPAKPAGTYSVYVITPGGGSNTLTMTVT